MTLLNAIAKANELRPNTIRDEFKAQWVAELEGDVAEMMGIGAPQFEYPNDADLLMPAPHDYIYVYRLCAMIDAANEETTLYANDSVVFNDAIAKAQSWWRRHNMPPHSDHNHIKGLWE